MEFENGNVKIKLSDSTLYAVIAGEIDHHSAKSIRDTIDAAMISTSPDALVMDLSGITFMDSSGLGLVLGRYTKATDSGIAFSLMGAGERCARMFDLAGLDRIIDYKTKETKKK